MRVLLVAAILFAVTVGCKKQAKVTAPTTAATATTPAPDTNYTPGAGAMQNVRAAAKRIATQAELANLGLLIESEYGLNMRMPTVDMVMPQVKKDTPNLAAAIEDKSVILCWTAKHDGVWAYQAGAPEHGGLALVSGSARRVEADELKQLLAQ